MFTGIIEGVGEVRSLKKKGEGAEIEISCDFDLEKMNIGDSISVNGCCPFRYPDPDCGRGAYQ